MLGGKRYRLHAQRSTPLLEPIHPAMPVILHEEDYDRWLGGEVDELCALAQPFPSHLTILG
jgi:putative SOS response-associated peptidase YedK